MISSSGFQLTQLVKFFIIKPYLHKKPISIKNNYHEVYIIG